MAEIQATGVAVAPAFDVAGPAVTAPATLHQRDLFGRQNNYDSCGYYSLLNSGMGFCYLSCRPSHELTQLHRVGYLAMRRRGRLDHDLQDHRLALWLLPEHLHDMLPQRI
jgi:hypothetical protein